MTSSVKTGKWYVDKKSLNLKPIIPPNVYYDTNSKRWYDTSSSFRFDMNESYFVNKYKIKHGKIYWTYNDLNGKQRFTTCPYSKLPTDTNEIEKAIWFNQVNCIFSGFKGTPHRVYYKYIKKS